MKPNAIVIKFHTVERDGARVTITEAVDVKTGDVVAAYSLGMMRAWLKRNGYRWRYGSNGIWQRAEAA